MTSNDHRWKDEDIQSLFDRTEVPDTPPDREFLARLREQTTKVFEATGRDAKLSGKRRRSSMTWFTLVRGVAAAAAVAIAVTVFMFTGSSNGSDTAFADVLDKVNFAQSLHVKIIRDGKPTEAWVKQGERLRINNPDGTYAIARGERLWMIDEKANFARSYESQQYFAGGKLDTLTLLDLPSASRGGALQGVEPVGEITRDDKKYKLYRGTLTSGGGELAVEALVDPRTDALYELTCFKRTGDKKTPVVSMRVLAINKSVDEDLFVVGDALTVDRRIGKIVDSQGIVSVRPVMHKRWTPVTGAMIVRTGDWVRTDIRGANAAAIRLVEHTKVIVGPGSLIELTDPKTVKVISGHIKIAADKDVGVKLIGPDKIIDITDTATYSVVGERLIALKADPLWLKGFEGATSSESIGSLVANIDGRNVPLTVGYHKVTVDIRDQIARTVIEESFVNHTKGRLEGVFHFPLPQDASISGFGMWIGGELVEADVVEKQRAREIYEEILRERRDPGLLEWTGGNIFKARVFPIEPHSEKRVKITYTQVLPMRGKRYVYSYALQSEMLKLNPLRELSLDVKIHSALPLAKVTSPTHMTRIDQTANAAHVEFAAQEHTPHRDFEVVVEIAGNRPDVVMIPHRRGADGYFMLQLTPPADNGQWQRELVGEGDPLELLILADTSGSMRPAEREKQVQVIATLLTSLTENDRFNLAVSDVETAWVFDKPMAATAENIAKARTSLEDRSSLGWTDLDAAFAAAAKQASAGSHVIYIGDGVNTVGDADPVALAGRLRRNWSVKHATCHALSVGSSYESVVLKAIASLGGGSMRNVGGEITAQRAAAELLAEITQPSLRDLKVSFTGLRTARVYPESLPNLPGGTQQILLGRYLADGEDQSGQVTVMAMRSGKAVKFSSPVILTDAERGNSFIPRLWARMHLDTLLAQGPAPQIKDEIISLSEEYHIITPYTSLLVLESDEDRERFGVKRRFQMRDGERFFADGRDAANYQLKQKQMRLAGLWRLNMRRQMLGELSTLGRFIEHGAYYPGRPQPRPPHGGPWRLDSRMRKGGSRGRGRGGGSGSLFGEGPVDAEYMDAALSAESLDYWSEDSRSLDRRGDFLAVDYTSGLEPMRPQIPPPTFGGRSPFGIDADRSRPFSNGHWKSNEENYGLYSVPAKKIAWSRVSERSSMSSERREDYQSADRFNARYEGLPRGVGNLWPYLPEAPKKLPAPRRVWPAEAKVLFERVSRTRQIASLPGGLRIKTHSEYHDPRWDRITGSSEADIVASSDGWITRMAYLGAQTTVQWCSGSIRGIYNVAFGLGRTRKSVAEDLTPLHVGLKGYVLQSPEQSCVTYDLSIKRIDASETLVVLKAPAPSKREVYIRIDTERDAVVAIEERNNGKIAATVRFDDFAKVDGAWWARKVERLDDKGRLTRRVKLTLRVLEAPQLKQAFVSLDKELKAGAILADPLPTIRQAKQALADGKADFEDRIVLMNHHIASQLWDKAFEHMSAAEKLAESKAPMVWLRDELLILARRNDELRKRLQSRVRTIVEGLGRENFYLARHIVSQARGYLSPNERLRLLDEIRPIYERQPAPLIAMSEWYETKASDLSTVGRNAESLEVLKLRAEQFLHVVNAHVNYANALAGSGRYEDAYAWLDRVVDREKRWYPWQISRLRSTYVQMLYNQGSYKRAVEYIQGWLETKPETIQPYAMYLSALYHSGSDTQADALMTEWISQPRQAVDADKFALAKLEAVVNQALGQGYNMHSGRIEPRWIASLERVALAMSTSVKNGRVADKIMGHWRFRQSVAFQNVRAAVARALPSQIETLDVVRLRSIVGWAGANDPALPKEFWLGIAKALDKRWSAEKEPNAKHQLGGILTQTTLRQHIGEDECLSFLRRQLAEGPKDFRDSYTAQLFEVLLERRWSKENEGEALALLMRRPSNSQTPQQLAWQVQQLSRWIDAMELQRYKMLMEKIAHQEKLTRVELARTKKENLRLVRIALAERLEAAATSSTGDLKGWLAAEAMYLRVRAGSDLPKILANCLERLGSRPLVIDNDDPAAGLKLALLNRYLVTAAYLSVRRDAAEGSADNVLAWIERGIKAAGDEVEADLWRREKYRLLIALDRPKPLEKSLRSWIRPDNANNMWRVSLAYVLAEQGSIAPAVELLEQVEKADELRPGEYRALAGWYMVLDKKDRHERALIQVFKTMEQWRLENYLRSQVRLWRGSDIPLTSELDPQIMRVFAALFAKSSNPAHHLRYLREFYRATRDFRLLAVLADSVIGHTAGKVYPFVRNTYSVLNEIRDEATADSVVEHIAKVRSRAETAVDHRAIDLLEALIERRSSELLNQPGPHVERALAALTRAFKREWAAGEPRLMAELLGDMDHISQKALADEQLRQLEALHGMARPGTSDRLAISHSWARAQWGHSNVKAIDLLQTALDEYRQAHDGVLPADGRSVLDTFISYLERKEHFARAESVLQDFVRKPASVYENHWMTQRTYRVYQYALRSRGTVSLGSGQELYEAATAQLQTVLAETEDQNHRHALIQILCDIYRESKERNLAGVKEDLKAFAFKFLPVLLEKQTNNYQSIVSNATDTLRSVCGYRDALAFLIERIESEPAWLRMKGNDGWRQFANQLGEYRQKAGDIGDLVPRLLKIVLAALRRDLRTNEDSCTSMYHRRRSHFWSEKVSDFARVVEEVYKERKHFSISVTYIARYLWGGLGHHARAIEMLKAAYDEEILSVRGEQQLVDYLFARNRHKETIAILERGVELRPDNLRHRTDLMRACYHTGRIDRLKEVLEQSDEYFHKKGQWNKSAMSQLASACRDTALYAEAVAYYEELIPLYQRTAPGRGIGDGTLSNYYRALSSCYSRLGQTAKAVDAACGAIVSWGPRHDDRIRAINSLCNVIRGAKDLAAYVKQLDKQAEETGMYNPVVRKAIGQVYAERKRWACAIVQLKLAAELQSNDIETQQSLVECYEKSGDHAGAVRQLHAAIHLMRRNIKLYRQLGEKYRKLDQPNQAERAFTSIVEALPNESEGHAALAGIHQDQDRWEDSIVHWRQVTKIRSLEPAGLLGLAAAQIHLQRWDQASETLKKLESKGWPSRFDDKLKQVRKFHHQIEQGREKHPATVR